VLFLNKGLQPSNSTDALFRAWGKFIVDSMVAAGWVQTADTGQIDFATVTHPLAANTAMGYAILVMDDALQATAPIYLRLDFGSASAANNMGLWITLGGGSDTAGVITPVYFRSPTTSSATIQVASNSATLSPTFSFLSGDVNRVTVALCLNAVTVSNSLVFGIERTKNASGTDNSAGMLLSYANGSGTWNRYSYLFASPQPQPPQESGFAYIASGRSPSATTQDVGVSLLFPFAGQAKTPGTNMLVGRALDWNVDSRIEVSVYGRTVTYQALFNERTAITPVNSGDNNGVTFMRFD
jgi:hypothetical protein